MKKNRMMRLASGLLVAVLLTTCAISGTFAKYVSTASGDDNARVAYWGFGLDSSIEIDDLFVDVYDTATDPTVDSKGDKGDDVIAPGTKNFKTFKFAYTDNEAESATAPEVSYTFKVDVTKSEIAEDIENNPNIQWALVKVDGTAAIPAEDSSEWGTWDTLMADIAALSGEADGEKLYAPNTAPEAFAQDTEWVIAWQWKFSTSDAQDVADTAMGNKQTLDTVEIVIAITATQVN